MGKPPISKEDRESMVQLRQTGHSVPEIACITHHGKATVFKYVRDIRPLPAFVNVLRQKQGGSKTRAERQWNDSFLEAKKLLPSLNERDYLCVLIGIYWGEGTKKELNLINSDPKMIKMFLRGLEILGVQKSDIRISIRLFEEMSTKMAKTFWVRTLFVDPGSIKNIYYIKKGSKEGKHKYGMCRVRVAQSAKYFKLLMSLIHLVADSTSPRSSMDRTAHS